ncbi:hypothetical protein [uncultured Microbulbifer sp.]|uniref:hypothetical protein n=1 Tax=uncultured Microbulbifer sp. TaxID=348147 RepID=UPI0026356D7C|nr:hypothetical protein [uncultured Microbulbifer sp.]
MSGKQKAQRWREHNGYTGKGGVVVLFNDKVCGWMNELRDPQGWEPGCIALDEHGNQWQASGGDSYNGAERWEVMS